MGPIADIFGYLLNWLYELVQSYGWAIILFSIITKVILLPISIKQQQSMEKSSKMQPKIKEMQEKYKENKEKLNEEMFRMYKEEKMNPFSGCVSMVIQLVLLVAMFFLVRSPLTHMLKMDSVEVEQYVNEVKENSENGEKITYPEIAVVKEKGFLNMEFLGLNLGEVPSQNMKNWKVYIIPILYLIFSFGTSRLTLNMQNGKKKEDKTEENEMDKAMQMNNSMMMFMPLLSVYIAFIAPLGLGLYWLMNSLLQVIQQWIMMQISKRKGENV
jgi:membrane protein insertase, YidC/Oxa1 family, C-terminal domain